MATTNKTETTETLLARIEKLRSALSFYASKDNYEDQDSSSGDPECCGGPNPYYPVVNDEGDRARGALKKDDKAGGQ